MREEQQSERQDPPRHGLARWLLRLPHVLPRHGRAADRSRASKSTWSTARWSTPRSFPRTWTSRWSKARSAAKRICTRSRLVRDRTRILVSLGDCAVTGNVPAMRNPFGATAMLRSRLPRERRRSIPQIPDRGRPAVAAPTRPGARGRPGRYLSFPAVRRPPTLIFSVLSELLEGRRRNLSAKTQIRS